MEEEHDSHYLEGKSRVSSMDYPGAIEQFEAALEANPHSGAAHFELGILFEEKQPDPAAAIYHYEQFLKLRPNYENADVIRLRIANCKQDLAKTALPLPITPEMRRQFEQLLDENKRLREELERWKAYAASRAQGPTNNPSPDSTPGRPADTASLLPSGPAADTRTRPPASAQRTHTVQSGESFYAIARKYGVNLEALMAANPGVDARRLRVGQTLNLPSP